MGTRPWMTGGWSFNYKFATLFLKYQINRVDEKKKREKLLIK